MLWVTALVILAGGTTYRDPFDQLKWTDFVHFYTLGHIARNGPVSDLYNPQTQYEHQVALVPASAPEHYLPVYPPQVALVFAPLGNLPYHLAAVLWALVNIVVYGGAVYLAWRPMRHVLAPYALVGIAAAAFPPFWNLILHGQTHRYPAHRVRCGRDRHRAQPKDPGGRRVRLAVDQTSIRSGAGGGGSGLW